MPEMVRLPSGAIEWRPTPAEMSASERFALLDPAVNSVQDYQVAKIEALEEWLSTAIEKFPSAALGSTHTYLADVRSMAFLQSEYSFVRGSDYNGETVKWFTVEEGKVDHTGQQIAQVFLDGRSFVKEKESTFDDLVQQTKDATEINQIIIINPPSS